MVFMLEAVLLFSPISSVMRGAGYSTKRRWHWILQTCAVCSALTGFVVITTNKYMADKQHYTSWHGLLGIVYVTGPARINHVSTRGLFCLCSIITINQIKPLLLLQNLMDFLLKFMEMGYHIQR